ncbi:hypothetical protein LCGC14_1155970 [marine sediment metagenome]|uniref:Uncharacterized protein n=1 Tax=marine sediment metagenome TaxID=412755 RepID=A0A0F9PZL1_9ZZZZ
MGSPGPLAEGFGFFAYSEPADICVFGCTYRGILLNDALEKTLSPLVQAALETRLGLEAGSLDGLTIGDILWKL